MEEFLDGITIMLVVRIILVVIGLTIYFIPTIFSSYKKDANKIFVLNLLLGWTLIGWIAALVWALSPGKHNHYYNYICPKCGYMHQLDHKVKLYECPKCHAKYNKSLFRLKRKVKTLTEINPWVFI